MSKTVEETKKLKQTTIGKAKYQAHNTCLLPTKSEIVGMLIEFNQDGEHWSRIMLESSVNNANTNEDNMSSNSVKYEYFKIKSNACHTIIDIIGHSKGEGVVHKYMFVQNSMKYVLTLSSYAFRTRK